MTRAHLRDRGHRVVQKLKLELFGSRSKKSHVRLNDDVCHLITQTVARSDDPVRLQDLKALCLVPGAFNYFATRALYRTIDITSSTLDHPRTAKRVYRLCRTLTSLVRGAARCEMIRSLRIDMPSTVHFSLPWKKNSFELMAPALGQMKNLVDLAILTDCKAGVQILWPTSQFPFKLTRFETKFVLDKRLLPFLQSQSDIVDLTMRSPPSLNIAALPPGTLPKLTKFTGMLATAAIVLPGLPVCDLHLLDPYALDVALDAAHIARCGQSMGPVQIIRFEWANIALRPAELTCLVDRLPHIRELRSCQFRRRELDGVIETLSRLQDLRVLYLCNGSEADEAWMIDPDVPDQVFDRLRAQCPRFSRLIWKYKDRSMPVPELTWVKVVVSQGYH